MKYLFSLALLCCGTMLFSQNNNNPTIAVCNGNQYVCATSNTVQICVRIIVNPAYPQINNIDKFEVDWGDGSAITTVSGSTNPPNQQHTYSLGSFYNSCDPAKEYTIKLLTKHKNGVLPANSLFILTVLNPPIAKFTISDPVTCVGQTVTFSDMSCPPGFEEPNWNFGDGVTLNNQLFSDHTYATAGTYTVTHSVKNSCGTNATTETITVLNPPIADVKIDSGALTGNPPVVCLTGGGIVKLDAGISQNETSYQWSVTPSSGWQWWPPAMPPPTPPPTGPKPRIRFTQPGTYTIKVVVNNDCNLPDEKTIEIKVVDAPILTLDPQPDRCEGIAYSPSPNTPNASYTINGTAQGGFPVNLPLSSNPYIVVGTLSNECGNQTVRDTFRLETPQDVTITAPASGLTVCTGSMPIMLTAAPPGGIWQGQYISQSGGSTVFTPPNSPGDFLLKYVRQPGVAGCERSKVVLIKVEQSYNLQLAPQPNGCNSLAYTPSPNDLNVKYTLNGTQQTQWPQTLPASPDPYIVTASVTNTCGTKMLTDTFYVLSPEVVSIQAPAKDTTVCQNTAPLPLTASPAGGEWLGSNISGPAGNHVFNPTTVGSFPVVYKRGEGNCERRDEVTITVEEAYNLQLAPQPDDCISLNYTPQPNDPNAQYTFNGAAQPQWPKTLGVSADPYIVTASVTNACGTKTLIDSFYVNAPEAVNILTPAKDTTVCQNTAPLPLAASPNNGDWTGQNISGPAGSQAFNPTLVGTFPIVYIRGIGNCEKRDTVTVKVEEAYNLQLAPQPDDCISLSYTPQPNDPNVQYTFNSTPQTQWPKVLGESLTPYIVTATHTNTCDTKVLSDTFFVNAPTPVRILAPADTIVCQNSGPITLSADPPGGAWKGNHISGTIFSPAAGGVFPLIYIRGTGNCEKRDTTNIEVIAVNIEAGPNLAKCIQDPPFTLTNFNPATGGTWAGAGITSAAGNFDPGAAGVGSHVLRYEFVDPILGCKFFDSLTIEVNPMPESDFPQPTSACINEEIPFENNSKSKFKVLWDFGDGQISMDSVPTHTYTDTGTYTIKLTTTNEFGCADMMTRTIFVTEPPFAFFTHMPDTGCAVLPVVVQNGSYGWQTSYVWSYGNLHTDSTYAPLPMLLPGGTKDTFYVITLTATNLCATRVWTDSVLVHPLPITRFGTATDTICTGQTIEFSNNVLGQPEAYFWDFGNGQTSTDSLPGPVQYFTDTVFRTYTVRLVATNFCGSDTFEHEITVKPVEVRAFFNVPNLVGCQPYTVQFTNFATPGAAVTWQFGDGGSSFDTNPTHTFAQPGTYKVVQKASDGCGYDSTFTLIEVLPAPRVSFECKPQICRGDTLFFTNTSPDPLAAVRWDFGDGDTSNFYDPFHIFGSAGTKTVTLTGIFAQNGCLAPFSQTVTVLELPIVNFAPDRPDGCVPLTVGFQNQSQGATYFEWDFGDGNTQPGIAPTHTFEQAGQFEIKLVGVDLSGCREDTLLRYITVHPIPSPAFEMRRDRLCGLPVVVDFVNQTPDAVGYTWTFGDGTGASPQNNPQHSYPQPGDFEVRLIAENTFGCRDTTAQVFGAYGQPEVGFDWSPDEGCAPLTVFFENLSTFTTRASWAFSDGGTSDSLAGTAHTFYEWGKHGATLIVSHRDVCFDTLALPDIIKVFPSPTANFSFAETVTDPPSGMFTFTDLSSGAVRWLWEFGDGDSSTLPSPAHRYFSNGPKLVRLTVWGENGCPDDTVRSVTPMQMRGLFIPDAFTPALANGLAAIFQPAGVGLREFEIAVYSSFGQLLWRSGTEDLVRGQPGPGWDGTFKGELLPQDVYTWQVKKAIFEDGTSWGGKRVGSVTLIR